MFLLRWLHLPVMYHLHPKPEDLWERKNEPTREGSNLGRGLLVGQRSLYLEHAVYEDWEHCLCWFHGMSGVTIGIWSYTDWR